MPTQKKKVSRKTISFGPKIKKKRKNKPLQKKAALSSPYLIDPLMAFKLSAFGEAVLGLVFVLFFFFLVSKKIKCTQRMSYPRGDCDNKIV